MNKFSKKLLCSSIIMMSIGGIAYAAQNNKSTEGHQHGESCGPMMHGGDFKERMAKHQTELHDKLKLTAQQESAWKTYTEAIKPQDKMQRPNPADWDKLTAPERMEKMVAAMKEHQSHMEKHLSALKTFYATLTPEQQKIFNENMGHKHGRHMGRK